MRDDINPLTIPAQNSRPHLIALVHANLPLESRHHPAEHDTPAACDWLPFLIQNQSFPFVVLELLDPGLEEGANEMRACDVEVGEVRAVGLMQVVVTLHERGVRGRDYRQEEC